MSLHPTFYFAGGQINNWCEKDGTIFIVPTIEKRESRTEPDFLSLLAIMVRKGGAGAAPRPLHPNPPAEKPNNQEQKS